MMKIFVLRHGQTFMNERDEIQGLTDDILNSNGIEQAKIVGQKIANFSKENQIDLIFSSPLKRAKQTAQIVAEEIEKVTKEKKEIQIDKRLIEQCYGNLEGKSRLSEEFAISKTQLTYPTGETGESHFKLAQRTYNFLDEILTLQKDFCEKSNKNDFESKGETKCEGKSETQKSNLNILLVTHGGIARVIATYFKKMTVTEYANWRAENCQLDEYEID